MRLPFAISVGVALISLANSTIAQAEYWLFPIIYEVEGVSEGDMLNVREEPNPNAFILGDLLEGQQAEVTAFDESGRWARVLWQGEDGWVARQYLSEVEQFGDDFSGMPVNLYCSGNEPFWSAEITPNNQLNFAKPESPTATMPIENSAMSRNNLRSNYVFKTPRFTGFIRRAECSDGMSDMTYGWALDLLTNNEEEAELLSGCCHTNLPVIDGY